MLFLISTVSAFFITDLTNKNFMSVDSKGTVSMRPVGEATDFEPVSGKYFTHSLSLKDTKSGRVLDQSGNGPKLIAYGYHGAANQCFRIVLTPDNNYLLMNNNQCLSIVSKSEGLVRSDCSTTSTHFSILFEVSHIETPFKKNLFDEERRTNRHLEYDLHDFMHTHSGYALNAPSYHYRYETRW